VVEAGKGDEAAEEDARHLRTMCKHLDLGEEARDSKDVLTPKQDIPIWNMMMTKRLSYQTKTIKESSHQQQ
jgi:hypothetical protein